ncbi:hypothetical protein [Aquimarina sp. 2201CG5-10]|uniref:hypothetical protein n=1 Tax=Aquimarina callyspongiae TaxID=3098150 RepID=UPI002AB496DD|nr:hypothetical protein [Aquimarina sp. 2201CG5-10]MDY8135355.1 hypothetical protein [Aquimarina sp. 2201CG5-10]
MKKILNLSGIQKLSKEQQKEITGAARPRVYCGGPRQCCINHGGNEFCDYGYCMPNGNCIWA